MERNKNINVGYYINSNGSVSETHIIFATINGISSEDKGNDTAVHTVDLVFEDGSRTTASTPDASVINQYVLGTLIMIVVQKDVNKGLLICHPLTAFNTQIK